MTVQLFSVCFLFGTFQAILLLIAVNVKAVLPQRQRFLVSGLLLSLGMAMFYYVVILNEYTVIYPYVDSLGSAAWMAIMPFFYLVSKSLLPISWRMDWKHQLLLFIPVLFVLEGWLTTLGFPVWWYQWIDNPSLYLDIWMLMFFGTGLPLGWRSLYNFQQLDISSPNYSLRWFSGVFLVVLMVFSLIFLLIRGNYLPIFELTLLMLFEVFIFVVVFQFFHTNGITAMFGSKKMPSALPSAKELTYWSVELEALMETQKPFLDQKLNLNQLSEITGRSPNDLSRLFSHYYRSKFYDFVNQYRLAHLEAILLEPESAQYKIIALAEASGFNSKTTFYKVFKQKHQMTPTQFLKQRLPT